MYRNVEFFLLYNFILASHLSENRDEFSDFTIFACFYTIFSAIFAFLDKTHFLFEKSLHLRLISDPVIIYKLLRQSVFIQNFISTSDAARTLKHV